jgi:hypothetical protein
MKIQYVCCDAIDEIAPAPEPVDIEDLRPEDLPAPLTLADWKAIFAKHAPGCEWAAQTSALLAASD